MKQSIDNILKELTFEEKCRLLTGSAALSSAAIERLCVPSLNMSDGPHGVRRLIGHPTCPQECHIEGGDTCFPTASAVGSSWNRKTAYDAGRAIADILFGKVNPSGKLSETFPIREREGLEYPGDGVKCEYSEKQNVGYRYYDAHPQEVWFPFGHGISYTEFQYSDLVLSENKITSDVFSLLVSFKLKNIGKVTGKEAVQLYVAPLDAIVARPIKELRAFDKIELKAGEEKNVSFTLTDKDFAYYNVCLHDRHVESGAYRVMIGASCTDIRLSSTLSVLYDGDYTKDKFDGSMVL